MFENNRLIIPYFAPYFAYVAIASLFSDLPTELNYILRIILSGALLYWAWKYFFPVTGTKNPLFSVITGIVVGLLGVVLWIALLYPFVEPGDETTWSLTSSILRIIAAGFLVPLFEELIMRGYIFRFTLQYQEIRAQKNESPFQECLDNRSIDNVSPASWSWLAIVVSTLVFTLGHKYHEYPACIGYGLLMCFLLIYRRDILSCIVAHSVTNIALAIFVITTKNYHFW